MIKIQKNWLRTIRQLTILGVIIIFASYSAIGSELGKNSVDSGFKLKSYSSAKKRSVVWTFGPMIVGASLGALGLLIGPRTGLAYAGKRRSYNSSFNRLTIAAGGFVSSGLVWLALGGEINILGPPKKAPPQANAAALIVLTSSGLFIVHSIINDFTSLESYVNEYNAKHGLTTLSIEPAYFTKTKAIGVSLKMTF